MLYTEVNLSGYRHESVMTFMEKLYEALLFKGVQSRFRLSSEGDRLLIDLCLSERDDILDLLTPVFGKRANAAA